ncbi:MAG: amino acid adenylation domain-containing protein [Byssovorax sp.]
MSDASSKSDLLKRVSALSPEKRALLAKKLRQKAEEAQAIPRLPREPGATFPLSFGQRRIWFLDRLTPGSPTYNEAFAFRIEGALDPVLFERAINAIIERQEALRTRFVTEAGEPVQVILPSLTIACPVVDLSAHPTEEREARAMERAVSGARAPFDLATGPLLRVELLRIAKAEHLFVLTIHHIATDGWTFGVFLRELSAHYQALAASKPAALPALQTQYADFASFQLGWMDGERVATQLAYWKQKLGGDLPVLQLPTDRPRPAAYTFRGARERLVLPPALAQAIRALGEKNEVTLFITLLSAYKTLLYRYSGQPDVIVGSPTAGRNRVEVEDLAGVFVNNLVLRTDLAGNPSFRELLGRVREVAFAAFAHQDVPFERLLEELSPERDPSRAPFFQVFFNILTFADTRLAPPDLALVPVDLDIGTSLFDITLYAIEERDRLSLVANYNPDLFDAATITGMLKHLGALLDAVTRDPDQRIDEIPLLGEEDRARVMARHAAMVHPPLSFVPFPAEQADQTLHRRFETQVALYPERPAVVRDGKVVTYAELNRMANRIARRIVALHGEEPATVALLFEHGATMIAGMLGALKAGKGYVPLDRSYPRERLTYILADSQALSILTNAENLDLAHELSRGTVPAHRIDADDAALSTDDLDLAVDPGALAYILYTSGSTGTPKGVAQCHRNVLHLMRAYTNALKISPEDRCTLFSSFAFDAAVADIYGALMNGAALCPLSVREEGLAHIAGWLVDNKVTIYHSTPTFFRHFMASLPAGAVFPGIRLVIMGGEETVKADVLAYRAHFRHTSVLVNGLGPTESTVAMLGFFDHKSHIVGNSVPVGYPVPGVEVLLLTDDGRRAGVAGEIAIRSPHVALGYFRKPDLTRAAFLPDPDGGDRRIYRTGDLGRMLPDGQVGFTGRRDFQVKIRGYRVELGEIEATIVKHPAVQECAVVARPDPSGEKAIAAYVVFAQEKTATTEELAAFVEEKLPAYMLPAAWMVMPSLPLTPTGKIARRSLPAPTFQGAAPEAGFVAPRHAVEVELTRIWERVLGTAPIGVRDNFFERGGHSLLALRLFMEIEKTLGQNLPLATLFQAPTIEQMGRILRRGGDASSWSSLVPIQPEGTGSPFFCVHALGGNVLNYRLLSRHLGEQQRFYGLQSQGLDGKRAPHARVEDMAACYLNEIRMVQPKGPYYLGGASSGGTVAWEMARQLTAAGEKVALLALIDSYYRGHERYLPDPRPGRTGLDYFLSRVDFHMGNLVTRDRLSQIQYLARQAKGRVRMTALQLMGKDPRPVPTEELSPVIRRVRKDNGQAMIDYYPPRYPGKVTLFYATGEPVRQFQDRRLMWSALADGGLEVHLLTGEHETVLDEPHVLVLARELRECIRRAAERAARER